MVGIIPLTQGFSAIVDDEDFEAVLKFKWRANVQCLVSGAKKVYALRSIRIDGRQRSLYLHRFLMVAEVGATVDHVNGDGLDCRRANLRFASVTQNSANSDRAARPTCPFRGVAWHARDRHYRATITEGRHNRWIGCFSDPIEAARAYDAAARKAFGAFARVNFPLPGEAAALNQSSL